jgi:hypothetical protein
VLCATPARTVLLAKPLRGERATIQELASPVPIVGD